MGSFRKELWLFPVVLAAAILASSVIAETIYVDGRSGEDENSGTKERPVRTVGRATGPEVTYEEKNLVKKGTVVLEKDKRTRNYLHVVEGTFGSDLGAGLFRKQKEK